MLRSCKTEIKLTKEQQNKVNRTIGVCRYVYNLYIRHNQEVYEKEKKFVSAVDFSKWLNNEYLTNNSEYSWIKEVSGKSVKQSIRNCETAFKKFFKGLSNFPRFKKKKHNNVKMYFVKNDAKTSKSVKQSIRNCETAFKKFFKGLSNFPRFKKKKHNNVKMYFVKNDAKTIIQCERHRIKIPTLGWVRLKEKGYLPSHSDNCVIKSGHVSKAADKYFVSITFDIDISRPTLGWVRLKEKGYLPSHSDNCVIKSGHVSKAADKYFVSITFDIDISRNKELKLDVPGIGIDLGIKSLATVSNGDVYININKENKIRKLEKKLKRENKKLSRKLESYKKLSEKEKGEATRRNIYKQTVKVQRIYYRPYI